ncbi:MAG: hypothetical protein K2X46_02300 [Roseomonas sp.]|nr:hypothetical protein [Roseomonas sp.]
MALLVVGCATDIKDMRLEGVAPIASAEPLPSRFTGEDARRFGGVVATFSSERDLRRHVARFGDSFSAIVERCAGRTHIEDRWLPRQWIGHGDFLDELGVLANAGRGTAEDPWRLGAMAGVPRDGRFTFMLPIDLEAYATERPSDTSGWVTRRVPEQDLSRAPDDLCVFARGWTAFQGVWRSNTVVIPYAAIGAALAVPPPTPR